MTTPNARQQHRFSIKQVVPALAAALAVALILCVRYDWWPLARNFENDSKLVFLALAAALLLAAGILWVVLMILVIRRRQWTWAVTVAPVIIAAGAVLAVYPGPTTFGDERPAFDQLVRRIMASPDKLAPNIKIGPFDVTAIEREDGGVYVYDADATAGHFSGWIYSPTSKPSYYNFRKLESIGGGWYEFRTSI